VKRCSILFVFASLAMASLAMAQGKFVDLGPQITATTIQGSAFVKDGGGRELIYTVVRGEPAHLLGYVVETEEKVVDVEVPHTSGAWNIAVSSDGQIYIPGDTGHVYRHKPGSLSLEDLGQALAEEKVIWDLCAGANGEVFGATYPGCRVFRYRTSEGFSDVCRGPVVDGENYVRCVAFHPLTGKVYAGVGSHAHLIEIDSATGKKTELLADRTSGEEAVYSLGIVPDEKTGDRLLAWVTNRNQAIVYNLKTRAVERETPSESVKSATRAPNSSLVYFGRADHLMSIDLNVPTAEPVEVVRCIGVNGSHWFGDDDLCILTRYAQLLHFHPSSGKSEMLSLKIPPQPIPLQSVELGPDGKIWMGGFLSGGTACYDPATGKSSLYKGMSQIERMGVLGGKLYFGVYPHGRFYQFDPGAAWSADGGNPRKIAQIAGQSRPIAVVAVPSLAKIFFGTVPEYGMAGGHLLEYTPGGDAMRDYGEVVPRQSIVALAYSHELIVGGTSISGGLGIEPVERQAKLFLFDPKSGEKIFETIPVPAATAITSLIIGPDQSIWGMANGTLFVFDVEQRKIVSQQELFPVDYKSRHGQVWRDAFLVVHPSGQLYGTVDGRFFRVDPATMRVTLLRESGVSLLAMDRQGRLYFRDSTNLWQYTPEAQ
jgi:streptogramin lyase